MAKSSILLSVALISTTMAYAQKSDTPILRIGENTYTMGEFDHMYNQNKSSALIPISRQAYLQLFINYKLKVNDAYATKADTSTTFKKESQYYINELTKPYFEDTLALKNLASQEFTRSKEEINAQHILVKLSPNASPADTAAAYAKIEAARKRIINGEDFAAVAKEVSNDPSAQKNNGDLGYFSALQMVMPFEDAAYATAVGDVSPIIRSTFGYHIIHVKDRREPEGQVLVQHIMKYAPANLPDSLQNLKAAAKAQIDSLYDVVSAPDADFGAIAKDNSDDKQSAQRGGLLPWFSRNQILPEFADAAFNLKEKGEISQPVQTSAGWHIICFNDRRKYRPEDEVETIVRRSASRMPQAKYASRNSVAKKLAQDYNFQWNRAGLDSLTAVMLSIKNKDERQNRLASITTTLATFNGKTISVADASTFANVWQQNDIPQDNHEALRAAILIDYETSLLESKYPDYAYTKREYTEGLLDFDVTQKNVWTQLPDSATMTKIYNANLPRYSTGGSFEGDIYFCYTLKDAKKIKSLLAKGKKEKAAKLAMKVVNGPIAQGDIYDDIIWPNSDADQYAILDGTRKDGTPLEIRKCRGQLITDYQQQLDDAYIKRLNDTYKPEILKEIE